MAQELPFVRKFLDCNIGHLEQRTLDLIRSDSVQEKMFKLGFATVYPTDFGVFFYAGHVGVHESISDPEAVGTLKKEHPSLYAVVQKAVELKCAYVFFDTDGEYVDDLPIYDTEWPLHATQEAPHVSD